MRGAAEARRHARSYRALYRRASRFYDELAHAKADGTSERAQRWHHLEAAKQVAESIVCVGEEVLADVAQQVVPQRRERGERDGAVFFPRPWRESTAATSVTWARTPRAASRAETLTASGGGTRAP